MAPTWLKFALWVRSHRSSDVQFRAFGEERSAALGQEARPLPYWKRRLAPWDQIKDGLWRPTPRYFVRHSPPCVYVRLPKCASTAVLSAWLPTMDVTLTSPLSDKELEAYAYSMQTRYLKRNETRYPRFTIVRHPVDRFIAVYRSYFQREPAIPFPFQHYLWGVLTPEMSLEEVLSAIINIPDRFRDPHFMSQTRLVGGNAALHKTRWYKLEELGPSNSVPELGVPLQLRNRGPEGPEISEALRTQIAALYAQDIKNFGY